ncbi:MAG: hypothetical protein OXP69_18075 [Spirochaetaceae bacterium]|nr:hypothetical protein [Spirochaetaceae bacterium]
MSAKCLISVRALGPKVADRLCAVGAEAAAAAAQARVEQVAHRVADHVQAVHHHRQAIVALRDIFTVVPLDAQILNQSIDSARGDFEDAIQLHSAVRVGARYLVTRNPAHFATDVLSVVPRTSTWLFSR